MVMTGFAPSKLFETPVDPDQLKVQLQLMQKSAEKLDDESAFKIWKSLDTAAAHKARMQHVIKEAKDRDNVNLDPVLSVLDLEGQEKLLDTYDEKCYGELGVPKVPAGVIDEALRDMAKFAAGKEPIEKMILEYPTKFLDWVERVCARLADVLTTATRTCSTVIRVPNVDIPITENAVLIVTWGSSYHGVGEKWFTTDIPWYGRHVVKQDWLSYVKLLARSLANELPEEIDEE